MKTNSSTHNDIAHRAHEIWNSRGSPVGLDQEIWFEAERQLTSGSSAAEENEAESAAGHLHRTDAPAASPDAAAAKATIQRNTARAPQHQHGNKAWKPAPPESGKPLWDKPHSS